MLFMSGCVFGQIQLCAHVLPRQCLVQLILAMGTVQARNLSSETFQLGAAFFEGELVLSIDIYFDTNCTLLKRSIYYRLVLSIDIYFDTN